MTFQRPFLPRRRLAHWVVAAGLLQASITVLAQAPAGCDEGVIRLPDRSGTIQICSALAARVPELTKQLARATASMGSQQAQIAELTRLVRGLNNVSRGIGVQRQTGMMESLSSELDKAQKSGTPDALARINEKLDGLQASLLGALSDPKMAAALGEALKGPVGEAIAKLDLSGASKQIEDIGERLKALQASVNEVRTDTGAIRQQLAQMDQRQQAAEGARQNREEVTIDLLKRLSGEIRELGQRGGLIDNPRTYAAHYHNARILAQRGETDLAMASYRQVFRTGVQMADPVIDLTTLLVRQYGRQGAARALARDFKGELPELSYLYGLQLLADGELDEVEALLFKDPARVADFPPLATIYLRRLHERLARNRAEKITPYTFQWSDTAGMGAVAQRVDKEIESGTYLAYFIDQIRAGRDLDDFRAVSDAFNRDKILRVGVPNLSGSEGLPRQRVDLMRSPVVLDYTYFLDPPSKEVLSDLMSRAAFMPRYKIGSVFLFIWDRALDPQKPIRICSGSGNAEQCKDINEPARRCNGRNGDRAIDCTMTQSIGNDQYFPPFLESHFVPQDLLGARCIGRVIYSTKKGVEISVEAKNLISAFRRPPDAEIGKIMGACNYDAQNAARPAGDPLAKPVGTPFARVQQPERPVAYNLGNCERVGYRGYRVYGTPTLAAHRMDNYLVKIAQAMKSYPQLPAAQEEGFSGQFDEKDKKCKLQLLIQGVPHTCTVARIVTSRWLPLVAPVRTSNMLNPGDVWNRGVFPDSNSPIDCVIDPTKVERYQKKPPVTGRIAEKLELLEASGIEHELEAWGAGHDTGCNTVGYTDIRYRIELDIGLRAIEKNVCVSGSPLRQAKLEAGQRASARQLNGCFTASGMEAYSKRAQEWLEGAAKDCRSAAGKQAAQWVKNAAEWAVGQP